MTHSPTVAVLPLHVTPPIDLSRIPLDHLHWPLGRPGRLAHGTAADLAPHDHLVLFPYNELWISRRGRLGAKLSLAIVEPRAHHRHHMVLADWLQRRFSYVITADECLLGRLTNPVFVPYGTTWVPDWKVLDLKKTHNLSLIASQKRRLPGHKLRHVCVDWLRAEAVDADILGRGYRPFARKSDGLAPYRFSVVIENIREPNYFTEKLIDAILCRTVPIYWGCPNIADFMDTSGMILCESFNDLKTAIHSVSPRLYEEKFPGLVAAESTAAHFVDYVGRAAQALLQADQPSRRS